MTDQEMITLAIKIFGIGIILILGLVIIQLLLPSPTQGNCWSHYQTENTAIKACEKSN